MTTELAVASKIAGKLFSVILSAKAAQIREWIEDQKINNILASTDKTEKTLEKYTRRMLLRCTSISTLVFPQEKISLESIYEPITLKPENTIERRKKEKTTIDYNANGKTYIITDEAGMGKSTFSKNLAINITLHSEKLPLFFEFSEYDPELPLLDNLAKDLNEIDKDFNKNLFAQLITNGKFFIILDGFDEIPRNKQRILSNEISDLNRKKGESSLLLTSRPHEKLPALENAQKLELTKLNENQAKSILKKLDKIKGKEIGKNLIMEFQKIPKRFLETPLLVGLLYRTYSFNRSIAKKTSVFYPEIYEALYKGHDLTKSGFERDKASKLEIDSFRLLLSSVCFLYIVDTKGKPHTREYFIDLIKRSKKITGVDKFFEEDYFEDLLTSVPLLTKDGKIFKFMHRTIAEFFCAEFIVRNRKSKELLEKITSSSQADQFEKTLDFVNEISENLFDSVITKNIAEKFIEKSKSSRKNKFYKTEIFLFESEFSIKNEIKKNEAAQKHKGVSYFPIKMSQDTIDLFLEIKFSKKIYTPRSALSKLIDTEENNLTEKASILEILGSTFMFYLKPEKKYGSSSKEIQSLFNDNAFLNHYALMLMLRGTSKETPLSQKPFISIEKCKNIIRKTGTTEKFNNELDLLIETL